MPRLSSMRSLGALTYPGLLLFLVLVLVSASSPVIAQPGDGAYGDSGRQAATLVNVASTVKRPDGFSSLSGVQALLYDDAVTVVHVDFTKIDYVSLKSFIDEFIESAAGQAGSNDPYRVQLRKYQKDQLKDDFKSLLATIQNIVVQKLYDNNIDEAYVVRYESSDESSPGATIIAVPLEGFSDAQKNKVVDALAGFSNSMAVFTRFGFAISVIKHDLALPPVDTSTIRARYIAKTLEKKQLQQALNEANGASYGSNNGQQTSERGPMVSSSLHRDSAASATNAAAVNAVANNMDQLNVEIDPEFRAEYKKEVEEELDSNRLKSRRVVLPSVRKRFGAPATADASLQLSKALRAANGAAVTIATVDLKSLIQSALETDASNSTQSDAFSGLGKDAAKKAFSIAETAAKNPAFKELVQAIAEQEVSDSVKSFTLAFSLVNTPQIVAFTGLSSADDAAKVSDSLQQFMGVIKPLARSFVESEIQESVGDAEGFDVSPLLDPIFESLKPKTADDKMTFVLDLGAVQQNAYVFSALLNGSDAQSGEDAGVEDIDWNTDGGDDSSVEDDRSSADEDDPYQQDEDDASIEKEAPPQDGDDEDGLFDDEEDEDDPFA